jgi:farnesyl-diphosphate farnesyltransferase
VVETQSTEPRSVRSEPLASPGAGGELLTSLLRDVSRSFYRTLRVLPGRIRPQISLAYLLARLTDTIADTGVLPVEQRRAALNRLRDRILGNAAAELDLSGFEAAQGSAAERLLVLRWREAVALLDRLAPADVTRIRKVIATITTGQDHDLVRFASASAPNIVPLRSDEELDAYTYEVAGCVGEFWTEICRAHLFASARLDDSRLLEEGVRFGKGLQLVNILRDLPVDLRGGRCYLPEPALREAGLSPADLVDPTQEARLRPIYGRYLERADAHLQAGWSYTNRLPRKLVRVRLACAWPILIGFRTLALLRAGRILNPDQRLKVSRSEVKGLMLKSVIAYPFAGAWRRLASSARGDVAANRCPG